MSSKIHPHHTNSSASPSRHSQAVSASAASSNSCFRALEPANTSSASGRLSISRRPTDYCLESCSDWFCPRISRRLPTRLRSVILVLVDIGLMARKWAKARRRRLFETCSAGNRRCHHRPLVKQGRRIRPERLRVFAQPQTSLRYQARSLGLHPNHQLLRRRTHRGLVSSRNRSRTYLYSSHLAPANRSKAAKALAHARDRGYSDDSGAKWKCPFRCPCGAERRFALRWVSREVRAGRKGRRRFVCFRLGWRLGIAGVLAGREGGKRGC